MCTELGGCTQVPGMYKRVHTHMCTLMHVLVCTCECVHVEHVCAHARVCVCIPLLCTWGGDMNTDVAGLPWQSCVPCPGPHSLLCTVSVV